MTKMNEHHTHQQRQQQRGERYHASTSSNRIRDDDVLDRAEVNDNPSVSGMESFDRLNLLVVLNDDDPPKYNNNSNINNNRYAHSPSVDKPVKEIEKGVGFDDISTDIETSSAVSSVTLHAGSSPTRIKRLLYVAHFLSQLTEVVWQFTIILYLCFILPSSLLLVSTYGLTVGLTSVLLGGKLGSMLDSKDTSSRSRMDGIKAVLLSHGVCIASCIGCSIAILWLLQNEEENNDNFDVLGTGEVVISKNETIAIDTTISNNETMALSAPKETSYQSLLNLLHHDPDSSSSPFIVAFSLIILHIFGALSEALNRVSAVALEKDWVVTVVSYLYDDDAEETEANSDNSDSQEDPSSPSPPTTICDRHLRDANVMMRQISLFCKVLGPALAGFFLHFSTSDDHVVHENEEDVVEHANTERNKFMWSMLVVGVLAITALVIQYVCMRMVYHYVPRLGIRESTNNNKDEAAYDGDNEMDNIKHEEEGNNGMKKASYFSELQVYLSQTISYGGIALALLHMNVLTVGAIMTSFLLSKGLSLDVLGLWRGLASVLGLAGTFAYKFSSSRTTLKFTALWSIGYFLFWLTICYGAIISLQGDDDDEKDDNGNNTVALTILIIGLYASRIGLWTFDMTISQMMQELVSEDVRCAVGGTQHALESFFYMLSFGLGLVYPEPDQFHILVVFGFSAVVLAFFTVWFEVYSNEWIQI